MIRTPWPSRSAPHHCSASQIDGSPNASPAWMVKCAFSRRRYSNASRCRVGGKPASAPAMSNPATSWSRNFTASSAISLDLAACRMAVSRARTRIDVPGRLGGDRPGGEPVEHRLHHLVKVKTLLHMQFRREPDLRVDDTVGGQILHAFRGDPDQRLPGLHHADGVRERLQIALERSGVRRLGEPAGQLAGVGAGQIRVAGAAAARSISVTGRTPPSRWSCSRTFGAELTVSMVSAVGGRRSGSSESVGHPPTLPGRRGRTAGRTRRRDDAARRPEHARGRVPGNVQGGDCRVAVP